MKRARRMNHPGWLMVFAVALACAAGAGAARQGVRMNDKTVQTGFINRSVSVGGVDRRYVVYVPREYTPDKAWPLILFLHGAGERGDDGLLQTEVGIGHAIRLNPDRFPCLVVMPQCPKDVWWHEVPEHIAAALEDALEAYRADPERIYLTGLSMGGFGTWIYGAAHVDTFAAFMPICGGGNPADAAKLAARPVWAFHGADDDTVPPEKSREMVEAVRRAGGHVQYTEYPGTGHNSWDNAYGDPASIPWLLKQRKPAAGEDGSGNNPKKP
ncbi:MAG TPA: dienelactone hydrolase family protein [Candidatus Hydrogenedentes bacterium]|nr:dienelactone hydrolase family protein [Candidatus Hydrogenedentota bacterium]